MSLTVPTPQITGSGGVPKCLRQSPVTHAGAPASALLAAGSAVVPPHAASMIKARGRQVFMRLLLAKGDGEVGHDARHLGGRVLAALSQRGDAPGHVVVEL